MSIPEAQLETWSHQGSITQSSNTYNSIKGVLEARDTPFADKNCHVFLQGSYGNDTNIYAESDVDVVIQCNDLFQHDLTALAVEERTAFQAAYSNATYTYADFKKDVQVTLEEAYGDDAKPGDKAIRIASSGGRRKADVIVAVQFRRYHKFNGLFDQRYDEGICFYNGSGVRICNYPKCHSRNLTAKHQQTSNWLKPMVRILKNMRSRLVEEKMIADGVAPSYYLEGLLYNVPVDRFDKTYTDTFVNCINWIQKDADKTKLVCANEQYYLLRDNSPVTWQLANCEKFLAAAIKFWNEWE